MKKTLFIITIISFLLACGNNEAAQSDTQENTEIKVSTSNDTEKLPCDLVSEAELKQLLSIPENVPTEIKNVVRTYPTCFYKWETIQFSETKMIGNNEVNINYPSEVTIVLVKDATEKMYNTSIEVYKDGQTQNGIGEMATWGGKMSQITFLSHGYMIHLFVKTSAVEAVNRESALKIASQIIRKL